MMDRLTEHLFKVTMEPIYEGCSVLICTQSSISTLGLRSWCEQEYQLQLMLRETTHLASCGRRFTKYLSYCEPDTAHGTKGTAIHSCHHEAYLLVVLGTLNWKFFTLECSYMTFGQFLNFPYVRFLHI